MHVHTYVHTHLCMHLCLVYVFDYYSYVRTVPLEVNVALAHKILSSEQNHLIEFQVPLYLQGTRLEQTSRELEDLNTSAYFASLYHSSMEYTILHVRTYN